ncbi:MAG: motility associated factor glycosyltransferase family protein [Lachnospiraceae bacterium]|nr:motility associated factor glycosyltransferase family protein [Lachnospiraceae bacterium]
MGLPLFLNGEMMMNETYLYLLCRKLEALADDPGDEADLKNETAGLAKPLTRVYDTFFETASASASAEDLAVILAGMKRTLAMLAGQSDDIRGELKAAASVIEMIRQKYATRPSEEELSAQAESFAGNLGIKNVRSVVCLFGCGDGRIVDAISGRLTDDSVFIAYEPGQDDLITLRDELAEHVDYYLQESMTVCCHPFYDEIYAREYADFLAVIRANRERIMVNKNTLKRFKEDAAKNVLKNLHILKKSNLVNELGKILPREVPVIIVAAGPSLDRNIELLREAKGHCLIFAVDTAMKYLLARDIIPDLGITIEPIKPMANYGDERAFSVPHVFDCESNPEIVGRHKARKFIYNCRDYERRLYEACGKEIPNLIGSGGSVATAAFAICYELGMKHIILIGQDLAYSGEATHAGAVESAGINNEIGNEYVEDIYGGKVRTRSDWLGYLRWFENAVEVIEDLKKDIEVIDATEGGAKIKGTKIMTLREAIDEYCLGKTGEEVDFCFESALGSLPFFLDGNEEALFDAAVRRSKAELAMLIEAAAEAVRICDRILSGTVKDEDADFLRRARKTCESALLYPLINNYGVSDIAEAVSRLRLSQSDPLSGVKQQRLAFDAIRGAGLYLSGLEFGL